VNIPKRKTKTRHSGAIWQRHPESCQERVVVMMLLLWMDLFCWLISISARSENTSRNTLSIYKDNTVCNPQAGFRFRCIRLSLIVQPVSKTFQEFGTVQLGLFRL